MRSVCKLDFTARDILIYYFFTDFRVDLVAVAFGTANGCHVSAEGSLGTLVDQPQVQSGGGGGRSGIM